MHSLPGSVVERDLQSSLSRMLPELLRYSSASRMVDLFPKELQDAHRCETNDAAKPKGQAGSSSGVWDGWDDSSAQANNYDDVSDDDVDLAGMGF